MEVIELIIANVARAIVFLLSSGLYIFLLTKTIPQLTLKHKSIGENTNDRGIKKYVFDEGRAVVYEPEFEFRKYVSQYMLISKNKHKFIKCRVNTNIKRIRYDVIAYDNKHKVIDVIGVDETVLGNKYSSSVLIPPETSYVSLVLRRVDKMFLSHDMRVKYSKTSMLICAALIVLATMAMGVIVNSCLKDIWRLFTVKPITTKKAIIWSGIIGAIASLPILKAYKKKNIKVTNK